MGETEDRRTPGWVAIMEMVVESALKRMHTSFPARVISYNSTAGTVSVQAMIMREYFDESENRQIEKLPVITDVPVMFPGGGGHRITFPILANDTITLFAASMSLELWHQTLGLQFVDPADSRRNALEDMYAVPGFRPLKNWHSDAPTDRMSLGLNDGVQINIDANEVRLGSNSASDRATMASELAAIKAFLAGAPGGIGSWASYTSANWPSVPGATKVKVE